MDRRRATWLARNILMTPFMPIRFFIMGVIKIGEAAEWVGLRLPGWRRYDGWSGW